MNKRAFTLIELLVVVLIIGILSAIALPQYQKAVERARMVEAITILRSIAQAHQVYYLANGTYLADTQLDLLDIDIPGKIITSGNTRGRTATKYYVYTPAASGCTGSDLAHARRYNTSTDDAIYSLRIQVEEPNKIICSILGGEDTKATEIQKQLCRQINITGQL